MSWSIADVPAGIVYIWLGVHLRMNMTLFVRSTFCKSAYCKRCVWYTIVKNKSMSPSNHCLYPNFLCTRRQFALDSHMKLSAHHFSICSALAVRTDCGFNSLGGRCKSLTQGLFAVRHHTWAETTGQRQMCLIVGGGGCVQYGASINEKNLRMHFKRMTLDWNISLVVFP